MIYRACVIIVSFTLACVTATAEAPAPQQLSDEQAVQGLRVKAEQGDSNAAMFLARLYFYGDHVPKDQVRAVQWYLKAAIEGNSDAEDVLGFLYFAGGVFDKDMAEAYRWMLRASVHGNAHSQEGLAVLYANGMGVAKNNVEALAWGMIAAENGDAGVRQTYENIVSHADAADVKSAVLRAAELKRQIAESTKGAAK